MNSEQDEYTTPTSLMSDPKSHQTFIIVVLLATLAAIVGGYIYMGMWWAKQATVPVAVEEVPTTEVSVSEESDRRQQIFNALEQATTTATTEEREAIINALEETSMTASEERKAAILEALNSSASTPGGTAISGEGQP